MSLKDSQTSSNKKLRNVSFSPKKIGLSQLGDLEVIDSVPVDSNLDSADFNNCASMAIPLEKSTIGIQGSKSLLPHQKQCCL